MEKTLNGRGELRRSAVVNDAVRPSGESDGMLLWEGEGVESVIWTATAAVGPGASETWTDESLSWSFGGWMETVVVLPPSSIVSADTCMCVCVW